MTEMVTGASPIAGSLTLTRAGFLVATIAAFFMTITEGLGTGIVPFWTRLAYWLVVMETGAMIGTGVTIGIQLWGRLRSHPMVEVLVIAVLIALPLTLAVIGAGIIFLGMERPAIGSIARNFALVAFISAIITAITHAIGHRKHQPARTLDPAPSLATSAHARFRARLPHHLQQARINALCSEDHYLRVRCDGGDALILMRLSDAIAELGADAGDGHGAQTHRSWWVARDAIAAARRGDGKGVLILHDGTEVPVSRTHYRRLVTAGWFG